jgi:hypothetical protein
MEIAAAESGHGRAQEHIVGGLDRGPRNFPDLDFPHARNHDGFHVMIPLSILAELSGNQETGLS